MIGAEPIGPEPKAERCGALASLGRQGAVPILATQALAVRGAVPDHQEPLHGRFPARHKTRHDSVTITL